MTRLTTLTMLLLLLVPAAAAADIAPRPKDPPPPAEETTPTPPTTADPTFTIQKMPRDLGVRLDEAILLLQFENFEGFVESFAAPAVLAEIQAEGGMEEIRKDAAAHPEKVHAMAAVLRTHRVTFQAEMTADGTVARFAAGENEKVLEVDYIVFQKVDGIWYIANE